MILFILFHDLKFVLLHLTVYIVPCHLKILNNRITYSICSNIYTIIYVKFNLNYKMIYLHFTLNRKNHIPSNRLKKAILFHDGFALEEMLYN